MYKIITSRKFKLVETLNNLFPAYNFTSGEEMVIRVESHKIMPDIVSHRFKIGIDLFEKYSSKSKFVTDESDALRKRTFRNNLITKSLYKWVVFKEEDFICKNGNVGIKVDSIKKKIDESARLKIWSKYTKPYYNKYSKNSKKKASRFSRASSFTPSAYHKRAGSFY